ncbi:4'-phosphopantetheinyl transferase family protein [Gloeobacter kilaueensis]|uniref:4'-phosphopantetheinyl transferase n=1 Tax=Gloeobacter kilaueensis (strain ATCC BAA-2537 / CCAP 1431/1 / ULC 316 / JS1) TaxID=1183438 RepID=U5QKC5_GLOK1|nr:4'-phosphopantetheinyl transferase superfamily protein [Gloeobacter kilaueensis]AGY58079.1 4'-phosphopantetheinyl transferase [Gloeobacter kilaueensis JS1]
MSATSTGPWPARLLPVILSQSEVHLWLVSLDLPETEIARLALLLAEDERQRAARFVRAVLTNRFIAGRGRLREILASYLGCPPAALHFTYTAHGKPELVGPAGTGDLQFNLSHSEDLALCAVRWKGRVGVDLEAEREMIDLEAMARQYFTQKEYHEICSLSPPLRSRKFLELWTFKEAYLKATGEGLAGLEKLQQIEAGEIAAGWSSVPLPPLPGFAAALVAEGEGWRLCCWRWQPVNIPDEGVAPDG